MRQVKFDPAQLQGEQRAWWDKWLARAKKAADKVDDDIRAGKAPSFDSGVWGDLKEWLLENVFYKKCAYCESNVTSTSFGDAEHYRPKGKVTMRAAGGETVVELQAGQPHPGYYWLAYDWRNLLPACQRCNSANGKMNQFPVGAQHRGPPPVDPDLLDQEEQPLLLHPYRHDPNEHLEFGAKGVVAGKTELGKKSVEVYDLDRGDLRTERQRTQETILLKYAAAWFTSATKDVPIKDELANVITPLLEGRDPHSAAALQTVLRKHAEYTGAIGTLTGGN